jgi:tetratricopeptide (TPR) repeat protein
VTIPNKSCLLAGCSLWALWACSPAPAPPAPASATVDDRLIPVARLFPGLEIKLDPSAYAARLFTVHQDQADVQVRLVSPSGEVRTFDAPARRATPERVCVNAGSGFSELHVTTHEPMAESTQQFRLVSTLLDAKAAELECAESDASRSGESSTEQDHLALASKYREAAARWKSLGRHARAGEASLNAAWMRARHTSDKAGALADGYEARSRYESAQDALGAARSALIIAVGRWALIEGGQVEAGRLATRDAMLEATQRDLELAVEAFDTAGVTFFAAESRNHLANSFYEQGRYAEAMRLFAEAANRFSSAGMREGEVRALANFNSVLRQVGSFREAADAFARLLGEHGSATTGQVLADILDGSAGTHSVVGDHDKALPQFVQALQIHAEAGDRPGMARSLNGLAATYMRLGMAAAALEYAKQARTVMREREMDRGPGTEAVEFASEMLTGNAQRALGQPLQAQASHRTALRFARNDPSRLQARLELIRDALEDGKVASARLEVDAARALADAGRDSQKLELQLEIARTEFHGGKLEDARRRLQSLEGRFASLGMPEYEIEALQLLSVMEWRTGGNETAMAANERTLDLLAALRSKIGNPELRARLTALHWSAYRFRFEILERERRMEESRARRAELLAEMFAAADATSAGLVYETSAAGKRDPAQLVRLREVAAEIALREHVLAALDSGGVPAAARDKLRRELAVLRARADALEPRAALRPQPELHAYDASKIRADTAVLRFMEVDGVFWVYQITRGRIDELSPGEPAADVPAITNYPHLIIVGSVADEVWPMLTRNHDVTLALTLRDALRIAEMSDQQRRPDLSRAALFFDPVFTPYDTRIKAAPMTSQVFPMRARLTATAREAAAITSRLTATKIEQFSGFQATRSAAMSEAVDRATVLHFATHAIASDQWPNGSGLLLTAFDETGKPLNGFVSTLDFLSRRASTELVVLSACDTASGDSAAGENVAGLARAFLGGGARRVVASRWKVDDALTAQLMDEFYRGLAAAQTPAVALVNAKRALAERHPPQAQPAWEAFVLYERSPPGD